MTTKPVAFGIPVTPELLMKGLMLAFSLGMLYMKLDSIEKRVTRIEVYIDSQRGKP